MRRLGISLLVLLMAVTFVSGNAGTGFCAEEEPLLVYCGAGLMKPMDELYPMFQEKHDCQVRMVYAGSGELFGMIATRQNGDVYIPGAEKYTKDALAKGMVVEKGTETICYHVPVILTPKGNPGNITCLEDLAKEGLRLALADSKAAAIGKTETRCLPRTASVKLLRRTWLPDPARQISFLSTLPPDRWMQPLPGRTSPHGPSRKGKLRSSISNHRRTLSRPYLRLWFPIRRDPSWLSNS